MKDFFKKNWHYFLIGIIIILLVVFLFRGNSSYKDKLKAKDEAFRAQQSIIDDKDKQIGYLTKYAIYWHSKSDSLDNAIFKLQHIRHDKKITYTQVHAVIDSLTDPEIDNYFSTGSLPTK